MNVWLPKSEDPDLIIRLSIFQLTKPMWPLYVNVTDGQMGGQTDRQTDDLQWQYRALHYGHRAVE